MGTTTAMDHALREEKKEEGPPRPPAAGIQVAVAAGPRAPAAPASGRADPAASPALATPRYYLAGFHAHFLPPDDDPGVDASSRPPRQRLSVPQRYAMSMARRPWTHLGAALVVALVLSFVGFRFGDFNVAIDNSGWWSRGTEIANRATQERMVTMHRRALFDDATGEVWEELQTVVQPDWMAPPAADAARRRLADDDAAGAACARDAGWYGSAAMTRGDHLFPVWQAADGTSALDAAALHGLCAAEERTRAALAAAGACAGCDGDDADDGGTGCAAPYSLVLLARLHLTGARDAAAALGGLAAAVPCDALRAAWTPAARRSFALKLRTCATWAVRVAAGGNATVTIQGATITMTDPCPFPVPFSPTLVDEAFVAGDAPDAVRYTSSIYATKGGSDDVRAMFEANERDAYDRGAGTPLAGVYDTTYEDFVELYTDSILGKDMTLAVGSAGVTIIAMVIHTRSPFLTLMGLCQILLSFPLAYFVYYFLGRLSFFPFLNFIGIFVVFALGADDVFVAVDKWKNARRELPRGTTAQVAALALPDAAYSMLLTSLTTAVAFFGTAICPVGPIVCFAVFCGLLITLDYAMNIFLVFPALCLYDRWRLAGSRNCCVTLEGCGRRPGAGASDAAEGDVRARPAVNDAAHDVEGQARESAASFPSGRAPGKDGARRDAPAAEPRTWMHRGLDAYYALLHQFRWLVLAAVIAATVACLVFALRLEQPLTSDVALLPASNEYAKHQEWKQHLLSNQLLKTENKARILWGLTPADTGNHLDPSTWTTLVLDEAFDPTPADSQSYLLSFCVRLFAAFGKVSEDYECPITAFDAWLKEQSSSDTPADAYTQHCDRALSVPVDPAVFDPCMIAWSQLHNVTSVLQTEGRIKILEIRTKSNIFFDSPQSDLKAEWTAYENWLDDERQNSAPSGVDHMFHSDVSYWWMDVNQQMVKTAIGAMAIALACASAVIFVSSRSFVLTAFAGFSVLYVLAAATASLVGLGWNLGFLESVLFAILIGISCDFVLHVGHAYTMYPGSVSRHHRSQFALTHMGPSIIAAAFTTFMAAVVMIFTEITFFRKFAVILFMTILHSVIGCFVVFLVLCDCFGPAEPTKTYDAIRAQLCGSGQKGRETVQTVSGP